MRALRSPAFPLAIALSCIALPSAATGAAPSPAASPDRVAANSTTYQDSTGEDPQAPDITSIVVSNDDAGMITVRINVPNRPSLGQDMLIDYYVDSDNNTATGSQDIPGIDYVIQLARGEINLYKWDGSNFTRRFGDPSAVTLTFTYQGGITIRISAAELGNTKRFNFVTEVTTGVTIDPTTGNLDGTNAKSDAAPGGGAGFFNYRVQLVPPTLVAKKLTASPAKPAAGRSFSLRLVAARSDTGAVVQNGRVTCAGSAGSARLRAQTARVTGGAAVCTWVIPASAKGKTFRGSVTVTFEGLKATRSFTARIV